MNREHKIQLLKGLLSGEIRPEEFLIQSKETRLIIQNRETGLYNGMTREVLDREIQSSWPLTTFLIIKRREKTTVEAH